MFHPRPPGGDTVLRSRPTNPATWWALNVGYLVRLLRTRDDERTYEVVGVDPRSEHLAHLLGVHAADVERHNPGFDLQQLLRREDPPGTCRILAGGGDGVARVGLDWVSPWFRDLSVGTFVYRHDGRLAAQGLHRLVANDRMADRDDYFRRVGFHREGDELVRDVHG